MRPAMIHLTINTCFLFGVNLLVLPLFFGRRRTRICRRFFFPQKQRTKATVRHLDRLLALTVGNGRPELQAVFWLLTLGLAASIALATFQAGLTPGFSLLVSAVLGAVPYGILRLRLYLMQVGASHEGESLMSELLNQYKIHHLNMREAIQAAIPRLENKPYSRQALFRLASALHTARGPEAIQEAVERFHLAYDTQWSAMLAQNLALALSGGISVADGLEDGLEELRSLTRMWEDEAQGHAESFLLALFITPILYIGSLFVFFRVFHFTVAKFLDYQFHHPSGLRMFLILLLFSVSNVLVFFVIRRRKYDF